MPLYEPLGTARGRWVRAAELLPGDTVATRSGTATVVRVAPHARPEVVYNLHVEGTARYLVGACGVVVHNSPCSEAAAKAAHANKVDGRPATLYQKFDRDGNFRKWGVTKHEDPAKRYTRKQIDGGEVRSVERGPRDEMLRKERDLVERRPGPDNREPWAGRRLDE